MSITAVGSPGSLMPGYNKIVYYVDSTNKSITGFRYLWKVLDTATSTLIGTYRTAPRSTDGYGELDVQKVISNYLSYEQTIMNTPSFVVKAANSYKIFDVQLYEEYKTSWNFTFMGVYSAPGSTYDGYIYVQGSSSHPYGVTANLNQILINQTDGGVTYPQLEGLFTVVKVLAANTIVISIKATDVVGFSSSSIGGSTTFADQRKTISALQYTFSSQKAFNGVLDFPTFRSTTGTGITNLYGLTNALSTTKRGLTSLPIGTTQNDTLYVTPEQDLFVNYCNLNYAAGTSIGTITVKFTNSNGDIISKQISSATSSEGLVRMVPVGPNNAAQGSVSIISGTLPILKSDTDWIKFETYVGATQTSSTYKYYIDRRCNKNSYSLLFLDRLGSYLSFSFPLNTKETGSIKRETYKQRLGDLSSGMYNYDTFSAGTISTNISVDKSLELTTDWMSDTMSVLFQELLSSPAVYIKDSNSSDDSYRKVEVSETSFEVHRQKNKNLIKKTISVTYSNQDNINI